MTIWSGKRVVGTRMGKRRSASTPRSSRFIYGKDSNEGQHADGTGYSSQGGEVVRMITRRQFFFCGITLVFDVVNMED